jgi:hypothetical protein
MVILDHSMASFTRLLARALPYPSELLAICTGVITRKNACCLLSRRSSDGGAADIMQQQVLSFFSDNATTMT